MTGLHVTIPCLLAPHLIMCPAQNERIESLEFLPFAQNSPYNCLRNIMDPSDVVSHPNSGVHIHGLFLEGASWEEGKGDDEGYISDSKMKDGRELWMDLYMLPSELCGFMWYLSDFSCNSCHHLLGASSRDASGEHLLSPYWRNESCLWRNCLYFTGPVWSETCTIMGFEQKWAGANVSTGDWLP